MWPTSVTAVYKIAKLWSEHKRGQRFKLKAYGVELDASGISEIEFMALLTKIAELERHLEEHFEDGPLSRGDIKKALESAAKELTMQGYHRGL